MDYQPPLNGDTTDPDRPYVDANPAQGVEGSIPTGRAFEHPQREILAVIDHYLGTRDAADLTQLRQAIQAAIAGQGLGTAAFRDVGAAATNVPEVLAATGKLDPSIIPATSADILRKQILLNSLLDAMYEGTALRVLDAVADPYADTSKIDAGASSNYTHDAGGAYVHNPGAVVTSSAPTEWNGYTGNYTFTGDDIDCVSHGYGASIRTNDSFTGDFVIEWDVVTWGRETLVGVYPVANDGSFNQNIAASQCGASGVYMTTEPASILFYGNQSNEGSLTVNPAGKRSKLERVGSVIKWYLDDVLQYTFTYQTSAEVRIIMGHGNSGSLDNFDNFSWTIPGSAGDMSLVSISYEASAEPTAGYLLGIIEPVDAVTYGTDVLGDMTKDDGATWEAVTLAKVGTTGEGYDVVFGDVTFVASGDQTVRYRWRTANSKHIKLHGSILDAEA